MAEYDRQLSQIKRLPSPASRIANSVIAIAGLVAGCLLINTFVTRPYWHPYIETVTEVREALVENRDDVEIVFLGSSRVQSGVDPLGFDAANAKAGLDTFSFNFWIASAAYADLDFMIDTLQELQPPKLVSIVFEPRIDALPQLDFVTGMDNAYSKRVRYIYNIERCYETIQLVLGSQRRRRTKIRDSIEVATIAAISTSNLGVLPDILLPLERRRDDKAAIAEHRGQNPPKSTVGRAPYKIRTPDPDQGYRSIRPSEITALASLMGKIEQVGAEPVVLFVPALSSVASDRTLRDGIRQQIPDAQILDHIYSDIADPLFTDPTYWIDGTHLSLEGSNLVAGRLSASWRALRQQGDQAD